MTASMLRDIEAGKPVESEAILGDLLRRAAGAGDPSLLRVAYAHVKAYEARRERGFVRQSKGSAPPDDSGV
jgi:2-dehydropantoate 2-reductase